METYSSSNAAARNPEERVELNKLEHFTIDYLQKLFKQHGTEKKEKQAKTRTDRPRMT